MNKTRKLLEETILFSVSAISNGIRKECMDDEELMKRTAAIKTLAEAYDIVRRGKKGCC